MPVVNTAGSCLWLTQFEWKVEFMSWQQVTTLWVSLPCVLMKDRGGGRPKASGSSAVQATPSTVALWHWLSRQSCPAHSGTWSHQGRQAVVTYHYILLHIFTYLRVPAWFCSRTRHSTSRLDMYSLSLTIDIDSHSKEEIQLSKPHISIFGTLQIGHTIHDSQGHQHLQCWQFPG